METRYEIVADGWSNGADGTYGHGWTMADIEAAAKAFGVRVYVGTHGRVHAEDGESDEVVAEEIDEGKIKRELAELFGKIEGPVRLHWSESVAEPFPYSSFDSALTAMVDSAIEHGQTAEEIESIAYVVTEAEYQAELREKAVGAYMASMGSKGGKAPKPTSAENGKSGGRPRGRSIAIWSGDIKVGIWENETWLLRLFEDRALLKYPTVKWVNNSGSLAYVSSRITGEIHASLLKIAAEQIEDDADYTERVRELIWDEIR